MRRKSGSRMTRIGIRKGVALVLFFAVFLLFATSSFGADDISLLNAARRIASGNGSPSDEALLFMENRRVNHLAMEGKLESDVYRKTQFLYDARNRTLAAEAAREGGFFTAPEGGARLFKPGTDTDIQLVGTELTAVDVQRARHAYNSRVESYLLASGLKVERGVNWAARTETDIMPSPSRMKSGEEFVKAAAFINGDGGNMYVSPLAAEAQAKLDAGDPVSIAEGRAYAEEMKAKVEKMKRSKIELMERYREAGTLSERDFLAAEIRKAESHEAKYIERINRLERNVRGNTGESSFLLGAAGDRGPAAVHKRAEAGVDALSSHLTEKALRNYADTLGDLAVSSPSPERRAVLKEAVAATLKGLPPARQGDALASIEGRLGKEFAAELASEMKKTAGTVSKPGASGTILLKGAGILSTVLAGYNALAEESARTSSDPEYGRTALNFAYDMTLRSTVDAAGRDTAAYTKKQVEELKEYYRSRGEDPESLAVKLKIAAEASLKGTAYGTVKGAYELAKASGQWSGGAIVGGAETIIFLAGEALDTLNTLEVSAATLREQGMAQEVQDAKSVRSAKELVRELRRMADLAASQRALLEQNARWARSLDIWRSRALENLRSRLEEAEAFPDSKKMEEMLSEAERILPSGFKRITASSVVLQNTIRRLLTELKGGAIFAELSGEIAFIASEHEKNLAEFDALAERMKELGRLEFLGEIEDVFLSLEKEKNAIADLGVEAEKGAAIMKTNYETWRKAISEYDRIKKALARGYSYFYGKKGVPGWIVVKSDADSVKEPDRTVPEDFRADLGTLQRMKAVVALEVRRLPKQKADEKTPRMSLEKIKASSDSFESEYEKTFESLERTSQLLEELLLLRKDLSSGDMVPREEIHKTPPVPGGGEAEEKSAGFLFPLDLNETLLLKMGLSGTSEGNRKEREDVRDGYYLTEESLNTDFLMVLLTPDRKEIKVDLKGASGMPDLAGNRFFALVGTIAYNAKRSVVGYYLDSNMNRIERTPQGVYDAILVLNYSVIDSMATDDPAETLKFHSVRLGLEKDADVERLKTSGTSVLEKNGFRFSKQGSGDRDNGTWIYGAVEGRFIVNISFNLRSLRPDQRSLPAFEPDETALFLLEKLFPR